MATDSNVPVTVTGCYWPPSQGLNPQPPPTTPPAIGIGSNALYGTSWQAVSSGAWYVVISLTDLSVVVNEYDVWSWGNPLTNVPASVQPYVGNGDYFLFFVTSNIWLPGLPQGALYETLTSVGAGPVCLTGLEQLFTSLGSELVRAYSYILAATMDQGDAKGFESISYNTFAMLSFQFMPITIQGQTRYVPVPLG